MVMVRVGLRGGSWGSGNGGRRVRDDGDEVRRWGRESESDGSDERGDDGDSAAGSDDELDVSELGEIGEECCQVGEEKCSVPFELYDLPNMSGVLSVDVWNDCLTEEERFSLTKYLPDVDQETFAITMRELLSGGDFHFGSPLVKLFDMLKGGLCEPRVVQYQQGLNFLQKRKHYHRLREYHDSMVGSFIQMRHAWENCAGYSIKERLRVLNISRRQRNLMHEKLENIRVETDSSVGEESDEDFWSKRLKDVQLGLTKGHLAGGRSTLNLSSHKRGLIMEPTEHTKKNTKGTLKCAKKEMVGSFPSNHHGPGINSTPYGVTVAFPKQDQMVGYHPDIAHRTGGLIRVPGDVENLLQREHYSTTQSKMGKASLLKCGRINQSGVDLATNVSMGFPLPLKSTDLHYHRRKTNAKKMDREMMSMEQNGDKTANKFYSRDAGKNAKYYGELQRPSVSDQMNLVEDRNQNLSVKGIQVDWIKVAQQHKKAQETFTVDRQVGVDDFQKKKWEMDQKFNFGDSYQRTDQKGKSSLSFPFQRDEQLTKASPLDFRGKPMQNGDSGMQWKTGMDMSSQSEETESDSSEDVRKEEDISPMRIKLENPVGVSDTRHHASLGSMLYHKKINKLGRKKEKDYAQALDKVAFKFKDLSGQLPLGDSRTYSSVGKQEVIIDDPSYIYDKPSVAMHESYFPASMEADDNKKQARKYVKNSHTRVETGEKMRHASHKSHKKQKRKDDDDLFASRSSYMHGYLSEEVDELRATPRLEDQATINRLGKKGQDNEAHVTDSHDRLNFVGPNSMGKKRKGKGDITYGDALERSHSSSPQQVKRGKNSLAMASGPRFLVADMKDVELEAKPAKKPFTLITPTVHTGFSFSIIHLLSAVRMAMITPLTEDALEIAKRHEKSDDPNKSNRVQMHGKEGVPSPNENVEGDVSGQLRPKNLPCLTIQEVVNRVRSNPGDPCILETEEPLQDLVRGVLKLLSSKTAPLGAKGWKQLVCYEKSTKGWYWNGPVSSTLDLEIVEEVTSPEAWGLPHKMLVKLVDAFANWLKSGQETLLLMGRLPAPPSTLMQSTPDEKERFRDLRAQKSLTTISPSSEEVREYFRKEEALRYSIPDRAFLYTAADGRKSIVAPLRRGGGKPSSKARDHFMLKIERPPHVTVLCLVRDAAARLPGSIGTRADVCTLIRDSQYIVEDVSDAQINQVVSGALDRLHYERDPCVQFDGDRKLWVYLHREREEEDFEDDGTASTKKWKRPRKDASDIGAENLYDKMEIASKDLETNAETAQSLIGLAQSGVHSGHQGGWDVNSYPPDESKVSCLENSKNEDFDDETFGRERQVGLLTSSLL
ncbi:hypothetical protein Sjap_001663 [Stephania japonica]|uniref:DEUBAD domain-containing protein n=1 Tax=Stephania japonica TaxID=461633 RepID=A0AAP0KKC3_9MAGN